MVIYRTLTILLALICLSFGVFSAVVIPKKSALATVVPRMRIPGIIVGVLVLAYCAYAGCEMLPGSRWCKTFWALVPIVSVLLGYYMDFLFARALSGALIVLANYAIQNAFAYHCGCRPVYALAALIWGIAGMVFLAWPWRLRDLWSLCAKSSQCRYIVLVTSVVTAALLAGLPFFQA